MSTTVKLQCCVTPDFHVRKIKVNNFSELKVLVVQWFTSSSSENNSATTSTSANIKPESLIFDYVDEDGDELRLDSETEWKQLVESSKASAVAPGVVRIRVRLAGVDFGVPMPLPVAGSTSVVFGAGGGNNSLANFGSNNSLYSEVSGGNNNHQQQPQTQTQTQNQNNNNNNLSSSTSCTIPSPQNKNNKNDDDCCNNENSSNNIAPPPPLPQDKEEKKVEEENNTTKKEDDDVVVVDEHPEEEQEEKKKKEQQQQQEEEQKKIVEEEKIVVVDQTPSVGPSPPPQQETKQEEKKNQDDDATTNNNTNTSTSTSNIPSPNANTSNNKRFLSPNLRPAYKEALTLLSNLYKVNAEETILKMMGGAFRGAIRIQANLATGEIKFEINDTVLHEHVALRIQELINMNENQMACMIAGDFVHLYPNSSSGHYNYAVALTKADQLDTALAELQYAVFLGVLAADARADTDFKPLQKFMVFRTLGLEEDDKTKKAIPLMEMFPEMTVETALRLSSKHKNNLEAAANEYLGL